MNERGERAAKLFHDGKANCAQAVLAAFDDVTGLDERAALRISSSFGGGMGKLREVCGAMSGALMVLGMAYGPEDPDDQAAKAAHYARVQAFAARFREQTGSILCRELLGDQAGGGHVPAERTEQYYAERPCERFVRIAAQIVDEMLSAKA